MSEFLKRNLQFVIMLLIWVVSGFVAAPVAVGAVAISVILLKRKNMYSELITGFIFILILSDSRQYQLEFAKQVKDIYLILLALFFFFDRKQFPFKNTMVLPFIPFILWGFAMTTRSPEFQVAFQKTLSYGLLYLVIPAYFVKAFRDKGAIFLKDFVMFVSILFMIGLALIVLSPNFVFLAGRFSGILGNPNGLGIFTVLALILTVCVQIKFPDLFTRNELIMVYTFMALSAILSGSRNTLMCIFIFLLFTKFYKISYWYGFMAVIVAIMLYQVVFSNLPTILEALGLAKALRADTLENGSGRMVAWIFALNKLNADVKLFLFGGGFSFDEYLYHINYKALSALGHQGGVHNTYLALWLNTGIIGLALWLVGFLRSVFKAVTVSYTSFPMMYAVVFSAFFEAWLMGSLNPFHIMFLFILTLVTTNTSDFAIGTKDAVVENQTAEGEAKSLS